MKARFLLGPAGSGKTFRCLAEIREELLRAPEGPPLLLLAPKQATFQLERQLLDDEKFSDGKILSGYTRLHIFSFERLAQFVLENSSAPPPPLLSEEGRVMVLRALLEQKQSELKIFRASARMIGFVQQLSAILRELQRHQLPPEKLFGFAKEKDFSAPLRDKLHDLALLLRAYLDWLDEKKLQDASCVLDLAAEVLGKISSAANGQSPIRNPKSEILFAGLWLDGFAEMTPQEIQLLAAVIPFCKEATLAFCLDQAPKQRNDGSWFSIWSVIGQTFWNCRAKIESLPNCDLVLENLPRDPKKNRFANNVALRHLEESWTGGATVDLLPPSKTSLRLATCANPESEAILAAHEILKFVREGGRFREAAILLRRLEGYHDILRRVFLRYEIPFFLDRRESVAHHPLAELTRSALRTIAFDWRHDDWFGGLKSGLVFDGENKIDALENEALARGWKGDAWFCPLKANGEEIPWAEELRQKLLLPFLALKKDLGLALAPNGTLLTSALKKFWRELAVEEKLQAWSETKNESAIRNPQSAIHATVWEQMNGWLENLERAFAKQNFSLRDWLPVLDAGLGGLTAGVIPPALDQVLIGTVDRSRNPDLKLVLVLGVNETVFPASPRAGNLLTDSDRDELSRSEIYLGPNARELLGRERFYGYIACTRARERLVLTCAQRDTQDRTLNPSPFFSKLQGMFEGVEIETFSPPKSWSEAEHACELIGPLIRWQIADGKWPTAASMGGISEWSAFASVRTTLKNFAALKRKEELSREIAEQLYGPALKTSVSRIEQFAACPFKFFVDSGLRAEERKEFQLDARERGSFQHAVLAEFHNELCAEKKRWRDLTAKEGRERIIKIAMHLSPQFRDGLFAVDARARFTARALTTSLQDFVATLIEWMAQYEFDPFAVEMNFGGNDRRAPAWELELGNSHRLVFRGVVDRIDLCGDGDAALAVVIDYKSSARKLDPLLLANGIQLQLPAYLTVLQRWPEPKKIFGTKKLIPAGVFYVNLRGQFKNAQSRGEVLADMDGARQGAYQHAGRFDVAALAKLDKRNPPLSTQFKFRFKKDGAPYKTGCDAMRSEEFLQLLEGVEKNLVRMGREIFSGNIKVDPFQHGSKRACAQCELQSICRIDVWTHEWRILRQETNEAED